MDLILHHGLEGERGAVEEQNRDRLWKKRPAGLGDPHALQEVLSRWAAPRLADASDLPALAADGKRIRSANRHAAPTSRR